MATPPLNPSIFDDCMELMDEVTGTLPVADPSSKKMHQYGEQHITQTRKTLQVADPSLKTMQQIGDQNLTQSKRARSTPGVRRRGRPNMDDSENGGATRKERRKLQLRQAQRAYRFRKEEQLATLSQKIAELEQKLLTMRELNMSTQAAAMSAWLTVHLSMDPTLKLLQDDLQQILANIALAETGGPHSGAGSSIVIPAAQPRPLMWEATFLSEDMTPLATPYPRELVHSGTLDGVMNTLYMSNI
ncbi:hypothetical protein F1880_005998 [Penicillium rolfsii]|nr:hypothetical protein F1880_005998 [Penicillium rolfsii]